MPAADAKRTETARAVSTPRACGGCGAPLVGGRPQRRYCDGRCRARASRQRQTQRGARTQADNAVLPELLPLLLTADEAAALLRKTRTAIYAMVERGQLPGVTRVGRSLLFHRDQLLDWLDQKRTPSLEE